jgi:hypothetical protein
MTLTLAENILRCYSQGTLAEIRAGAEWYNDANVLAEHIGKGDAWKGAGLLAAYSPLTPWWRNVQLARESARTGYARQDSLPAAVSSARQILKGAHPLDVLKGDKVRAFCSAIADPHGSEIATIDRHAHDIAMGRVFSDNERKIGKRVFRELSEAYGIAASEIGFSVAQTQAITWVIWRARKGLK